jgi:hypothetical protein
LKEPAKRNYELRGLWLGGASGIGKRETFGDVVKEWLEARAKPMFTESYMRNGVLRLGSISAGVRAFEIGEITRVGVALCRKLEASVTVDTRTG